MSENDGYTRLYYRFPREFPEVYNDDRALSWWVRLLYVADASHPLHPPIPRSIPRRVLEYLVAQSVVVIDGDCYTMRGLDAERGRRSDSARNAAAVRWQSERNATAMPRRDETNRDETSTTREAPDDGRLDLEAFLLVRHRIPTPAQRRFMDDYLRHFDVSGPQRAERLILSHPDDPIGALKADLDEFRKQRLAELPPEPKRPSGVPSTLAANHRNGWHDSQPDPRCPLCEVAA